MELSDYLRTLEDPSSPLTVAGLQQLHDLRDADVELFREAWPQIELERRLKVVSQLDELAEDNVDLDFAAVFFTALDDEEGEVRAAGIRGLWEYEGRDLIERLLHLLEKDEEPLVRAEAAIALGRFVLKYETGDLRERYFQMVERGLRRSLEDELEEDEVRGRALESLGASDRPWIRDAILQAYDSEVPRSRVSALHAMGRSCERRWMPLLIDELRNDDPEMRFEAATALGSLGDGRAVSDLAPVLKDPDPEVQTAAIAALGQIGGREAQSLLRGLVANGDSGVQEAAEGALAEANFSDDPLTTEYRVT